jgi:hypothetical protein
VAAGASTSTPRVTAATTYLLAKLYAPRPRVAGGARGRPRRAPRPDAIARVIDTALNAPPSNAGLAVVGGDRGGDDGRAPPSGRPQRRARRTRYDDDQPGDPGDRPRAGPRAPADGVVVVRSELHRARAGTSRSRKRGLARAAADRVGRLDDRRGRSHRRRATDRSSMVYDSPPLARSERAVDSPARALLGSAPTACYCYAVAGHPVLPDGVAASSRSRDAAAHRDAATATATATDEAIAQRRRGHAAPRPAPADPPTRSADTGALLRGHFGLHGGQATPSTSSASARCRAIAAAARAGRRSPAQPGRAARRRASVIVPESAGFFLGDALAQRIGANARGRAHRPAAAPGALAATTASIRAWRSACWWSTTSSPPAPRSSRCSTWPPITTPPSPAVLVFGALDGTGFRAILNRRRVPGRSSARGGPGVDAASARSVPRVRPRRPAAVAGRRAELSAISRSPRWRSPAARTVMDLTAAG